MNIDYDFKIESHSPEESEKIQLKLFDMGYKWINGLYNIQHTDSKFLFVYCGKDRFITKEDIDRNYFNNHRFQELKLKDLIGFKFGR